MRALRIAAAVGLGIAIALAVMVLPALAQRESAVTARHWQWGTNRNASMAGTNSVIEATIAAINGQRVFLYSVSARCVGASPLVTIRDGLVTEAGSNQFTYVVGSPSIVNFTPAWTTQGSRGLYVSMATCSGAGRVDIQADQW